MWPSQQKSEQRRSVYHDHEWSSNRKEEGRVGESPSPPLSPPLPQSTTLGTKPLLHGPSVDTPVPEHSNPYEETNIWYQNLRWGYSIDEHSFSWMGFPLGLAGSYYSVAPASLEFMAILMPHLPKDYDDRYDHLTQFSQCLLTPCLCRYYPRVWAYGSIWHWGSW